MYNTHPCFWSKLSGKKSFILLFKIQLFIYLFRYLFFLYYKGILAFTFEHIMLQKFLYKNNCKTQEQAQGL